MLLHNLYRTCKEIADFKVVSINQHKLAQFCTEHATAVAELSTKLLNKPSGDLQAYAVRDQVILNSVNFCYWAGWAEYRSATGGAGKLYSLFRKLTDNPDIAFDTELLIEKFEEQLFLHRFPMMEERAAYLQSLPTDMSVYEKLTNTLIDNPNLDTMLNRLSKLSISFSGDLFLKRPVLLLQSLRYHEGLPVYTRGLPIPADYHIPAILNDVFGILDYSPELTAKLANNELIARHSKEEISLRAISILACQQIANVLSTDEGVIDQYLFPFRNSPSRKLPHHLTISTDY